LIVKFKKGIGDLIRGLIWTFLFIFFDLECLWICCPILCASLLLFIFPLIFIATVIFGSSLGLVIVNYLELDSDEPDETGDDEQDQVSTNQVQNTNPICDHVIYSALVTLYLISNFISTISIIAKVVFNIFDEFFEFRNFWFPRISKITGKLSAAKKLIDPKKEKLK